MTSILHMKKWGLGDFVKGLELWKTQAKNSSTGSLISQATFSTKILFCATRLLCQGKDPGSLLDVIVFLTCK